MKYRKFLGLLLPVMMCIGCSKDDKAPVDADDNFITALTLSKDGKTYAAEINGNEIMMSVPYTVNLNGAEATMAYTASAKILPDPVSVKDWDSDLVFRVTSFNGETNEYKYSVTKQEIESSGDVLLKTQEEVTAFTNTDITVVTGNLIIGNNAEGATEITDLSGLSVIKEVKGYIEILNNYKGGDLEGLKMTSIGGLKVGTEDAPSANSELYRLRLESVETITGDVHVFNGAVQFIEFDNVSLIAGSCQFSTAGLTTFQMPKLQEISGDLKFLDISQLQTLQLPMIEKIGGEWNIQKSEKLASVELPLLTEAGRIEYNVQNELEKLYLPALSIVNGDLKLTTEKIFTEGSGFDWVGNVRLEKIDGLSNLTQVKGMLTIANFDGLMEMPDFSKIQLLGGFEAYKMRKFGPLVGSVDLSNAVFQANEIEPKLQIGLNEQCQFAEVKTKEDLSNVDVAIAIYVGDAVDQQAPKLNIKKAKSFSSKITNFSSSTKPVFTFDVETVENDCYFDIATAKKVTINCPSLKSVGGYLSMLTSMQSQGFSFPELEEVGGQLICHPTIGVSTAAVEFPKLRNVGCATDPHYHRQGENSSTMYGTLHIPGGRTLSFPALEKVGGEGISISQSKDFDCPKLKTISKRLSISKPNSKFTTFKFPELKDVKEVYITNMKTTDFSVFYPMIQDGQITENNWNVSGCTYNPTYQDMKNGKYKQ